MSPLRRLVAAALVLLSASAARAGVGRAVELAVPGESSSFKTGASPLVSLQLAPMAPLSPLGLAPALAPSAAPAANVSVISALTAGAAPVTLQAAVPLGAPLAKPVDALILTGAALTKAAPGESSGELTKLFDGENVRPSAAASVDGGVPTARGPALAPATPRPSRKMPEGVKRAFQNSAVLGGGMAAIGGGLYAWTQQLASAPTPAQFALLALPLLIVPLHFALVSSFWASRYFAYPRLSPAAKSAFQTTWRALSIAYPLAAVAALAAWFQFIGNNPTMLLLMGAPALVALSEITHHFVYRVVPERAKDKKKSMLDWRDRLGGNIGQQLSRMRAKP